MADTDMIFGQRLGLKTFGDALPVGVSALVAWREICPGSVAIVKEGEINPPEVVFIWVEQNKSISGRIIERCD